MHKLKIVVLCMTMMLSADLFAQNVTVGTDDGAPVTLDTVIEAIESQTDWSFVYDKSQVDVSVPVTLKRRTASVRNMLDDIFATVGGGKYAYRMQGKNIVLVLNAHPTRPETAADGLHVSGTVTDALTGEPLPGAGVSLKGHPAVGTVTDMDGRYSLSGVPADATLLFSSLGFTDMEVAVGGKTKVDAALSENRETLKEVVVIGYGTMDKKELTSAVSHLSSKDFLSVSSSDPLMMIQGKVAGVSITNTGSGDPNNPASIQIRGVSSRDAGLSPLIIINGVPGELSNVNPNDIESFDILKDGAASAIYGTRGSNGVILVTTKSAPTDGSIHTSYSGTVSFDVPMQELDMLDAYGWRLNRVEGDRSGYDYGGETDWLKRVTRTGFAQSHTISLGGGVPKTNYRVTADYKDAKGIDLRSSRREYGMRASVNHTTKSGLLSFIANVAPRVAYIKASDWSTFTNAIEANPTTPVMDPDDPFHYFDFQGQTAANNPAEILETELADQEKKWIDWDATARLNLLPLLGNGKADNHTLTTQVTFSDRQYDSFDGTFSPSTSNRCIHAGRDGQAGRSYSKYRTHTLEWLGNWQAHFGDNNIKTMVGYSYTYEQNSGMAANNADFSNDGMTYNNLSFGEMASEEGKTNLSSHKSDSKLIAFFGRASYDWKGRYLLTASLRYEGSSKFGSNHKWGWFPAVSAGWRISDEPFMKNAGWISDLKLRGDFGVTGNQNFSSYLSLDTMYSFGAYSYNGEFFYVWGPQKNVNPDLHWEKGKNWNIGLDWALFKSRLYGSFNYYNRRQVDLLGEYTVPVPPYLFNTTYVNVGTMRNSGFEFDINWKAVDTKDFGYTVGIVGSTMKNEFVNFSNSEYVGQDYYDVCSTGSPYPNYTLQRIEKGRSVGSFFMYRYAGVDADGNWVVYNKDGDMILANTATVDDKQYVGNGLPKFTGSMTHSFRYKWFDLNIYLRTALGYDIFNIHEYMYGTRNFRGNVLKIAYGQNAAINKDANPVVCDYFLERGDYLKIDMVNLGFTLNTDWKYLSRIRLYVTGKNLCTFTKFTGIDPSAYNVNGLTPGAKGSGQYYPSSRQFILGVQLSF